MFLKYNNLNFHIHISNENLLNVKKPLILLHGFTGSSDDWNFLFNKINSDYVVIAIDLPGHGKSSSPENIKYYSFEFISNLLNFILIKMNLTNVSIAGYSMGGRIALSFAINNSHKIKKLILESSTAGIENRNDRLIRINNDNYLAKTIEGKGIENFVDYWLNQPLFNTLKNIPPEIYNALREKKLKNNPVGLANTLRGLGTGVMPNYWNRLQSLQIETLLISGELDKKFTEINSRLNSLLPNSNHKIIQNCGHNVHLEKPEEFVILLNEFLTH